MSKLQPLGTAGDGVVTTYSTVCSSFSQPLLTSSFPPISVLPPMTLLPTLHYAPLTTFDTQQQAPLTFQTLTSSFPHHGFPILSQPSNLLPSSFLSPPVSTTSHILPAPLTAKLEEDQESSEDEDLHLCGACKQQFQSYKVFSKHKKTCSARRLKAKKAEATPSTTNIEPERNTTSNITVTHSAQELTTTNPNLEANAIALLANQFSEGCQEQGKEVEEELVSWQVEEQELGGEGGEGEPMLCIQVQDQEAGIGQEVQFQTLHSISMPSPSPSLPYPMPSIQIQECTINFSLAEPESNHEQKMLPEQPSKTRKKSPEKSNKQDFGRKVHQCTFVGCLFTTKYSKDLNRHMTKHTGEKPFSCHLCGTTFGRQDKLNRHMHVHTGHKPFSCSVCGYKAVDRCTLKKHMRVHTDERPYHCQICPYRSKDSSQLTVHLRTHTGDAPFSCQEPDCAATFKTNSDLTRHIRIHTGEKPYKCEYCDHRVKIKSNLKAHIRVNHRPNEVFKCRFESCDFVSVSRSELRDHHKAHDTAEVLRCNYCSFTFSSRQRLDVHMAEHGTIGTGRPFKCSYCDYSAKSQAILSSHVNKRHGVIAASKSAKTLPHTKEARGMEKKGKLKDQEQLQSTKKESKVVLNKSICKPNFVCPVCPAGFVRRDSLRSHVKQHQRAGVPIPSLIETYVGGDSSRENVIKVLASSSRQGVAVQLGAVYSG